MPLSNNIVLKPRFKFIVNTDNEKLLKGFEETKSNQTTFIVSRIDNHIFIKLPKKDQHFWSPQLHLEINKNSENKTTIHGLFSPKPNVWTLFMFFHFIVICVFLGLGIWAYTNASLGNPYAIQLFFTLFMIVIWFTLYFAGRIGRTKGKPEMYQLHNFMKETLRTYR